MRMAQLSWPAAIDRRPLELCEGQDPEPGPGEVLLEVSACAVCRTDLQLAEGDLRRRRLPVVPGHQAVGRVIETGSNVDTVQPGDRAGVGWLGWTCGTCRFCRADRENLCEQAQFTGWDRDGGFATRMVADARFAFPLPPGLDDMAAAPLLCGGVIGYRSLVVSGIRRGGRLGLYGFGASATLAIQVAVDWGCEVFVATRSAAERERARSMGAAWTGGYDELPPSPLDAAVTFAPVGSVVVSALRALDRGGVVAINAIHLDSMPSFDYELLWLERQIRSVANFTRRDATEFLDLAARIPVQTAVQEYELDDANRALQHLKAGQVSGAAVLNVP